MRTNPWLSCLLACGFSVLIGSCDSSDSGGSGGTGGKTSSPDSGSGAANVDNPDPINDACPANDIGPSDGPFATKGDCCYRTSNKARIDDKAAERTLEFRLPYFMLINHLMTIDPILIGPTTIERYDNEELNLLIRFVLPQKDGKVAKGKGKLKIGPGRYNCDGTYSFYSNKAAPTDGGGAADRWFVPEVDLEVTNPEATDRTLVRAPFKTSLATQNRDSYLPYLGMAPTFGLDWEGQSQGFDFLEIPIGEDNYDCVGSRKSSTWSPAGKTVTYARLEPNDHSSIDLLGITFCQLMAFGARTDAPSCLTSQRCKPGEGDCKWLRLPDSLCPVTDEDKAKWGCHLGYGDNPDNAPLKPKCTQEAPKDVDPDKGTSEGQCCDPLARDDSGLPACNAWVQISDFVAASVEITDKTSDKLQESCHGK